MSIKGNQLTTLQELSQSPENFGDANGEGMRRRYAIAFAGVRAAIPDIGTEDDEFPDLVVSDWSYYRDGDAAILTVEYRGKELLTTIQPDGTDRVRSASANAMEIPIDQHPTLTTTQKEAFKASGVESYLSPQPTVRITRQVTGFAWSESAVTQNVGKRVAPPGISGATVANWLKTARDANDVGTNQLGQKITELVDSYQYDSAGFNTAIYPNTGTD